MAHIVTAVCFAGKYKFYENSCVVLIIYCVMAENWAPLQLFPHFCLIHYSDVIMSTMASEITSLTIVYSIVYSGGDQRKHESPASRAGNSLVTCEFPAQRASNAENVSIWWRHHAKEIWSVSKMTKFWTLSLVICGLCLQALTGWGVMQSDVLFWWYIP